MKENKNNIEIIKNSLDLYSYNGKDYKTEAAAKKAKTMDAKRNIKENKKQAYHQKHGLEKIKAAVANAAAEVETVYPPPNKH